MSRADLELPAGLYSPGDAPPVEGDLASLLAEPPEDGARRRRRFVLLGVTVIYAAIAVAAYLPTLPLDGSHTQFCTCGDTAQEVWFLGWAPFALTHAHSLFYSNWVLVPSGVNLTDNTAMTLLGVAASPVTALAGPVAAYNLVLRAAFTLSALAMFVTVRKLVRWWPAAFLAGLLYGFSPFMVGQGMSHEFLVFAPIPPLALGILADVFGRRTMPARRAGLLLGLLAAAQFLIAAETFVMMAVFGVLGSALALCYRRARGRIGHVMATAAWAAGACAVVIAEPLYVFFFGPQHIVGPPHGLGELYSWHGDALGALLPGPLVRFAPMSLLHVGAQLVSHNIQENGTYLGAPLVVVAAALGIAYRRRPVIAVSGVLAVVSYALSLGPRIYSGNNPANLPGPFALLAHVPVVQDIEPVRFSLFTALFVAVVLGAGLSELATVRWAGTVPGLAPPGRVFGGRAAVVAAIGAAALVPLIPRWPYPAGPPVTPRLFTTPAVARIPAGAVVVTLPYPARQFNEALVWQAEASMRFRLAGGSPFFVPGGNGRSLDSRYLKLRPHGIDRVFEEVFGPQPPGPPGSIRLQPWLISGIRTDLRRYHVSAVIIDPVAEHKPPPRSDYGMPPAWRLGAPPGLGLAVRYVTAAVGRPPQSAGGVLGWFGLRGTAGRAGSIGAAGHAGSAGTAGRAPP